MKIRRSPASAVSLLAVILLLTACQNSGSPETTAPAPETEDVQPSAAEKAGTTETAAAAAETETEASAAAEAAETESPETDAEDIDARAGAGEEDAGGEDQDGTVMPVHVVLTSVYDSAWDPETGGSMARNSYVKAMLSEEDAGRYPELARAMNSWNKSEDVRCGDVMQDLLAAYNETVSTAVDPASDIPVMESEINGSVMRADSRAVSIFHDYFSYSGGSHPNYGCCGINFDTATGRQLGLTDVISDMDGFIGLMKQGLEDNYSELAGKLPDIGAYFEDLDYHDPYTVCWSMDSEGLTYYFNPYDLGGFLMGAQEVKVFYADHPEVFVKKYTEVPEDYVIPFTREQRMLIDVNGDGTREEVSIEHIQDNDGYYSWKINAGRRSVLINDYCYSESSYIVRSGGQYYLYLFEVSDNDYSILAVVDLKTMEYDPEKSGNAILRQLASGWENDSEAGRIHSYSDTETFTDPTDFVLSRRMDILSSVRGDMKYHVGEDGYPVSDSVYYGISSGRVLQTKCALVCKLADEKGLTAGTGTLAEERYIVMVRTDGSTWVDVQEIARDNVTVTGDGDFVMMYTEKIPAPDFGKPVYRLEISHEDWPYTVNGIEEGNVFKGIVYAG